MKRIFGASLILACLAAIIFFKESKRELAQEPIITQAAIKRSFPIEIQTIGELEAAKSTSITSSLRGDLGKIIYLIADGSTVQINDVLVKLDPTPFEEQIEELKRQINDQRANVEVLEGFLKWETYQVEHEIKGVEIEIEAAKLELNKLLLGDGPIEEMRLKNDLNKATASLDGLKDFISDFESLNNNNYINQVEMNHAQKKLLEEEEAYLSAKLSYENFITYTHPLQLKKAETLLKRSQNRLEEMIKSGGFKIAKAKLQLEGAKQVLNEFKSKLKTVEQQLLLSVIKAPTGGMVVLKEDYRSGQKRKPRLGDIMVRNQTILDLPYLEKMLVKTKVREIDLYKIHKGTKATVTVDAYPELTLTGNVQTIGILALLDGYRGDSEKNFEVIIKLLTSDLRLRPGMTARITLHAHYVDNQLTVPIQAIFENDKKTYCVTKKGGNYVALPVAIGHCSDLWAEVTFGLKEGQEVLLSSPPLPIEEMVKNGG